MDSLGNLIAISDHNYLIEEIFFSFWDCRLICLGGFHLLFADRTSFGFVISAFLLSLNLHHFGSRHNRLWFHQYLDGRIRLVRDQMSHSLIPSRSTTTSSYDSMLYDPIQIHLFAFAYTYASMPSSWSTCDPKLWSQIDWNSSTEYQILWFWLGVVPLCWSFFGLNSWLCLEVLLLSYFMHDWLTSSNKGSSWSWLVSCQHYEYGPCSTNFDF